MRGQITPEQIQDYIEGRLRKDDEAFVEDYFRCHPGEAMRMRALRRQSERLRRFGERILNEPVPQRFRETLRRLCTGS
jgi:anti-sigma factor RsiW